mgnify:CR=1 FL=1
MGSAPEGGGPMLWIGAPCHQCRREDFLPFVCGGCGHLFCLDHFRAEDHACKSTRAGDMLVPLCPLCREPPRGWSRDADDAATARVMERHWGATSLAAGGCRELLPDSAPDADGKDRCAQTTCRRVLVVPITVCL